MFTIGGGMAQILRTVIAEQAARPQAVADPGRLPRPAAAAE
jgi:hypothetical protein